MARFGADWLGWDVDTGQAVPSRAPDLTEVARKYGFHATLKPPFRLAVGADQAALEVAVSALAIRLAPIAVARLDVTQMGRFFALTAGGETTALNALAAACVRDLDAFRAPAAPEDLARRRGRGLSAAQEAHLQRWGYPYVMDQFRFHMTLTGPVPKAQSAAVRSRIVAALPAPPAPYLLDEIALVGERGDGRFETIRRFALSGSTG